MLTAARRRATDDGGRWGQSHDARPLRALEHVCDRLALIPPLQHQHHIGIGGANLRALERHAQWSLHESAGVDEDALEAGGECLAHQSSRRVGGLADVANGRGVAYEFEREHLRVTEAAEGAGHASEADGRGRPDLRLADVGVHDGDALAARGQLAGQTRRQRCLAGVAGSQDECDTGLRRRLEGGIEGRHGFAGARGSAKPQAVRRPRRARDETRAGESEGA
jgi:hypothetical protein